MSICYKCKNFNDCTSPLRSEFVAKCDLYKEDSIDWEQRRYEIAKDILAVVLSKQHAMCDDLYKEAVSRADSLIKQLKKQLMIDRKKIEEAAKKYAVYPSTDGLGYERITSFKEGIHWIKKNLWHPMSDKPEIGAEILIQRNMEVYCKKHPAIGVNNTFVVKLDFNGDWESYAHDGEYKCWLYIEDLMKGR